MEIGYSTYEQFDLCYRPKQIIITIEFIKTFILLICKLLFQCQLNVYLYTNKRFLINLRIGFEVF